MTGPRIGESAPRIDGHEKVTGAFVYGTDLKAANMLFGATLRSPHAAARIRAIDLDAARAAPGVVAVLTAEDVPGAAVYGLEIADQPVFARAVVRYEGEPVAAVAAATREQARDALALIRVDYDDSAKCLRFAREAEGLPVQEMVQLVDTSVSMPMIATANASIEPAKIQTAARRARPRSRPQRACSDGRSLVGRRCGSHTPS